MSSVCVSVTEVKVKAERLTHKYQRAFNTALQRMNPPHSEHQRKISISHALSYRTEHMELRDRDNNIPD